MLEELKESRVYCMNGCGCWQVAAPAPGCDLCVTGGFIDGEFCSICSKHPDVGSTNYGCCCTVNEDGSINPMPWCGAEEFK